MTIHRICPICEAGCGLKFSADGRRVTAVRPNQADVFSAGHVCPKGIALAELDADPERLRTPLLRRAGGGTHVPVSWDEAFAAINAGLGAVRDRHGANAIALYIGNPTAHNIGLANGIPVTVAPA